jgi:hypothetical protein
MTTLGAGFFSSATFGLQEPAKNRDNANRKYFIG